MEKQSSIFYLIAITINTKLWILMTIQFMMLNNYN